MQGSRQRHTRHGRLQERDLDLRFRERPRRGAVARPGGAGRGQLQLRQGRGLDRHSLRAGAGRPPHHHAPKREARARACAGRPGRRVPHAVPLGGRARRRREAQGCHRAPGPLRGGAPQHPPGLVPGPCALRPAAARPGLRAGLLSAGHAAGGDCGPRPRGAPRRRCWRGPGAAEPRAGGEAPQPLRGGAGARPRAARRGHLRPRRGAPGPGGCRRGLGGLLARRRGRRDVPRPAGGRQGLPGESQGRDVVQPRRGDDAGRHEERARDAAGLLWPGRRHDRQLCNAQHGGSQCHHQQVPQLLGCSQARSEQWNHTP
mmetsp:Transcript_87500/g.242739  ORF Transcript_87500/g.242739 Transcript_87500/m.242739 type:complete len:316 (+) Transcript_87500:727-1674(+)